MVLNAARLTSNHHLVSFDKSDGRHCDPYLIPVVYLTFIVEGQVIAASISIIKITRITSLVIVPHIEQCSVGAPVSSDGGEYENKIWPTLVSDRDSIDGQG